MRALFHITLVFIVLANAVFADIRSEYAPSGSQSYVLTDVSTGKVLESYQANKALPPASVGKVPTSLYAMSKLGLEWRFQTRFVLTDAGELGVIGGGDPAIDTDALVRVAKKLKEQGITAPKGQLLLYTAALPNQNMLDKSQLAYVSYNPAISGLNLNFNRFYFEWKKQSDGYAFGLSAKTRKFAPPINSASVATGAHSTPIYKYKTNTGRDQWVVSKRALGGSGSRWLPVRNTSAYFADVFRYVAGEQGVKIPTARVVSTPPTGRVIAVESSAVLADMLRSMLKYSTNLSAETIGLHASIASGAKPKSVADSAKTMSRWLESRYGLNNVKLLDHSGLNDKSRMNTSGMVTLLNKSAPSLKPILKPIDLRNSDWKKAPVSGASVVAKTGTLNFVSALSGYLTTASGRELSFAIFTADMGKHNAVPEAQKERPAGGRTWARKSRVFQHALLRDWAMRY